MATGRSGGREGLTFLKELAKDTVKRTEWQPTNWEKIERYVVVVVVVVREIFISFIPCC